MKLCRIIDIINMLVVGIVLYLLMGCENMLEVDTPSNQLDAGQVFENVQTANAALAGLYANIWDNSPLSGGSQGSGALLGSYTDDQVCYYSSGETSGALDLYNNLQIASNSAVYMYWSSAYKEVYMANAIIEGAEKSKSLPEAEKNRIKGEALLIRSILFFYLQNVFGNIPMPLTTDYKINQFLSKTPSVEILSRLESDFRESANLLSDQYRSAERIFPNRKVAQLMLGKTYMLEGKWNEAEGALKTIVSSPLYIFEQDITKVFQKSGTHILWQLKPKNTNDPTLEVQTYYFSGASPGLYALNNDLIGSFSAFDKRRQNWIAPVTVGQNTWYRADKYKNRAANPTEYSVVFRMEEVYLNLAESLARQNKLSQALPYINYTRLRAGLSALTGMVSQQTVLEEVLLENRREFFCEMGHRFMDLKRFGRLSTLTAVKPNWKEYHHQWPIPQKELLLNPNLKPQNNGY
ncbi:Starch-binding associating with outer membrane [Chryseobacterium oleae]|uniref:Starch-binding associating with outer membrane n=1 Tax=Chryseobacterium oleae TaxID=491207 RepID=A0A1I4YVV2_CHROL|nr:RagB/SusD family nutrient uptake outer membrane protein [Chryseobacterium oleae]SFN42144.1 Starch-binding associating with outer membrane [Chryseobacterium oleae]